MSEHDTKECCEELDLVWKALEVSGYTGKSASEHVAEIMKVVKAAKGLKLEDGNLHGSDCEYHTDPETGICSLCEAEDKLRCALSSMTPTGGTGL